MSHEKRRNEAKWSALPVLVLWMIKDKLDIFDDMCVASVCHDWRAASLSYPKKQSIREGMPWLMQQNKNVDSSLQDFISITRKKKVTLYLPEFSNALVLFSKQGWVLLRRKNFVVTRERLPDSVFLINPLTKAKIELPDVAESHEFFGSFSTHDGYPVSVVLISAGIFCRITLRTAKPGDLVWTKHAPVERTMQFEGCRGLISIGEQIFYFDIWGKMTIYNMATRVWKELLRPRNELEGVNYIAEHDGKIIKLFAGGYDDHTSYAISVYNDADTSWERVKIDEMSSVWYLSRLHNCFCARESGSKIYLLRPKYGGLLRCTRTIRGYTVLSHELNDGGTQTLQLPYEIYPSAKWVDLG
ncbi:F-box/kelch-repeat protein At3g18720-like [Apium graveolens]|uniref:F-box/kelch-repeat protein At3g18720-like n=1 Tax=Apium graveolens TaxID=4045 RepID=UPI003D799647